MEVRICTNKVCKKQGSTQILQLAKDLALADYVDVIEVGCLGCCGAGPNVVVCMAEGDTAFTPLRLHHISTPAKMAEVLREVCGAPVDARLLRATELRLAGNAAAREGEFARAIQLYSEGLALDPPAGAHLLLSNRSGARLAASDVQGALEDADAAVAVAPPSFTTGAVRQAEALLALGQPRRAVECLQAACELPGQSSFAKSEAYRALVRQAQAMQARA